MIYFRFGATRTPVAAADDAAFGLSHRAYVQAMRAGLEERVIELAGMAPAPGLNRWLAACVGRVRRS